MCWCLLHVQGVQVYGARWAGRGRSASLRARVFLCVCVSLLPACAQAVLLGAGARGKHACCSADAARENLILFIIFNILLMTFA